MRVYDSNIYGNWKHRENGRLYHFRKCGVIVFSENSQKVFMFKIETKNEFSTLVFPDTKQRFPFVVMCHNYFSVRNNAGKILTLDKLIE